MECIAARINTQIFAVFLDETSQSSQQKFNDTCWTELPHSIILKAYIPLRYDNPLHPRNKVKVPPDQHFIQSLQNLNERILVSAFNTCELERTLTIYHDICKAEGW